MRESRTEVCWVQTCFMDSFLDSKRLTWITKKTEKGLSWEETGNNLIGSWKRAFEMKFARTG